MVSSVINMQSIKQPHNHGWTHQVILNSANQWECSHSVEYSHLREILSYHLYVSLTHTHTQYRAVLWACLVIVFKDTDWDSWAPVTFHLLYDTCCVWSQYETFTTGPQITAVSRAVLRKQSWWIFFTNSNARSTTM